MGTENALQDRQVETIDDLRQLEVISWNAPQVAIWDDAKAAQHQCGCPWDQATSGPSQPCPCRCSRAPSTARYTSAGVRRGSI